MERRLLQVKGSLVVYSTHREGGVNYKKQVLKTKAEGDVLEETWKTEKTLYSKKEYDQAQALLRKGATIIRNITTATPIGRVCKPERVEKLRAKIEKVKDEIREFNSTSEFVTASFPFAVFDIAASHKEALEAIVAGFKNAVDNLEQKIKEVDVKGIRAIISDLKGVEDLIVDDSVSLQVSAAIDAIKEQARKAKRDVEKKGEEVEKVAKKMSLAPVNVLRYAITTGEAGETVGSNKDDRDEETKIKAPVINASRFSEAAAE